MQQSMKESQEAYAIGRSIALLLLAVTLFLATLRGDQRHARALPCPIEQAVQHAERIAAGDLTKEILVTNQSEDRAIAAGYAGDEQPAVGNHQGRSRRICSGGVRGAAGFGFLAESFAGNQ